MAAMLALLGFFPAVGRWVTVMPPPVLGALALLLFGLVAVSGLRLISAHGITHRDALIIAVSVGLGIALPSNPEWLSQLPFAWRALLESGIAIGGLAALVLNLVLPGKENATASAAAARETLRSHLLKTEEKVTVTE